MFHLIKYVSQCEGLKAPERKKHILPNLTRVHKSFEKNKSKHKNVSKKCLFLFMYLNKNIYFRA